MTNTNALEALVEGRHVDEVLVLRLCADRIQTPEAAFEIRKQTTLLADEAQVTHLIVDFRRVQFISSIGLLAVMSLRRRVREARIVLAGLNGQVREIFSACRLISSQGNAAGLFETTETVEQALQELRR